MHVILVMAEVSVVFAMSEKSNEVLSVHLLVVLLLLRP